jgi:predicted porin
VISDTRRAPLILAGLVVAKSAVPAAAQTAAPAPQPPASSACSSVTEFINTHCPLTWNGLTFYGTVDMGVAWQSHGTPFNRYSSPGIEQLISKNSNRSLWTFAPNGLSQSNIGVKGNEELLPGLAFVFDLQAGFDPYSLQLANGPKSLEENNGVALTRQSSNGDSSRAGQFYNGLGYAGFSSSDFGTLTFGRQNSLTLDGVISYDPMGGSNDFSPIGYSGATAGIGDTEDARFTTSAKYRVSVGQFRAAALYQFGGYGAGNASTNAYQFQAGGDFLHRATGGLSLDAIYSHVEDAVSLAGLSAAQNLKAPGSLAATISNNTSEMLLAKYIYGPVKVYAGYEHILFQNPSIPQTTFSSIAGFNVFTPNINNTAYSKNKTLQIFWTGVKYSITPHLDVTGAYYHYLQGSYNTVACSNTSSSKCSGELNAASADVDWQFSAKADAYAGVMFSSVSSGLASGYLYHVTADPAVGVRFRF